MVPSAGIQSCVATIIVEAVAHEHVFSPTAAFRGCSDAAATWLLCLQSQNTRRMKKVHRSVLNWQVAVPSLGTGDPHPFQVVDVFGVI